MEVTPVQDPSGREATLSLVLKTIRKRRGFRSAEVARLMNMPHRSYQRFEAGDMGVDLPKIQKFADVVHADAWGILFAVEMGSAEFALYCAENQAATTLISTLRRFHMKAGKDTDSSIQRRIPPASLKGVARRQIASFWRRSRRSPPMSSTVASR